MILKFLCNFDSYSKGVNTILMAYNEYQIALLFDTKHPIEILLATYNLRYD